MGFLTGRLEGEDVRKDADVGGSVGPVLPAQARNTAEPAGVGGDDGQPAPWRSRTPTLRYRRAAGLMAGSSLMPMCDYTGFVWVKLKVRTRCNAEVRELV